MSMQAPFSRSFGFASLALAVAALLALTASALAAPPAEFGTEGSGAGQISNEPQGIAVDQETGDLYVADNHNRIDKFDYLAHTA